MTCSIHSTKRTKERSGFKGKTAQRFQENAFARGLTAEAFYTKERQHLESISRDGCRPIVYNGYCFIFNDHDVCVTMYRLPSWFRTTRKKRPKGKFKESECTI